MKDREEFLASVYAKRDAELVKRKKYKKRMVSGLSAAAACLVLTVGLVQMDVLDFQRAVAEGAADGAVMESINGAFIPPGGGTEMTDDVQAVDDLSSEDGLREDVVVPGQAAPQKDIFDLAPDTDSSGTAYYCLPCFSIEQWGDGSASMTHGAGIEDVEKVQAWVDQLEENGQLLQEEPDSMEGVTCIVTIELESQQKDIYYLTGEVGWYE